MLEQKIAICFAIQASLVYIFSLYYYYACMLSAFEPLFKTVGPHCVYKVSISDSEMARVQRGVSTQYLKNPKKYFIRVADLFHVH